MSEQTSTSLETLALTLQESLSVKPWFQSVEVGKNSESDCLVVYIQSNMSQTDKLKMPKKWHNIPVIVRKTGTILT